jgi:hypothetical protein
MTNFLHNGPLLFSALVNEPRINAEIRKRDFMAGRHNKSKYIILRNICIFVPYHTIILLLKMAYKIMTPGYDHRIIMKL